jgi:Flp pilus assembly protein TadB
MKAMFSTQFSKIIALLTLVSFLLFSNVYATSMSGKVDKEARKTEKIQKFLKSKFGQWLVKIAIKKSEKQAIRYQEKVEKASATGKVLREKSTQKTNISTLLLVGIILMVVGLVLLLVSTVIGLIIFLAGVIMLIVGLL